MSTITLPAIPLLCNNCHPYMGYRRQRADERLGVLPRGTNQEPLVVKEKVGRPQASLGWASAWNVTIFRSALWHCWLGIRKGIWSVKSWMLVLLLVAIWLELSTSYNSSYHQHCCQP